MRKLLFVPLLLCFTALADTMTSVNANVYDPSGTFSCTQSAPTSSSCAEGNALGYLTDPGTPYATATATISAPGVLSVSAYAFGADVDGGRICCHDGNGNAVASASFSYMLEVIGGVGQVLVAIDANYSGCADISSIFGYQSCNLPTVLLGGSSSDSYLATYGVPFSFTGSVTAYAYPDYNESWYGEEQIILPLSDLVLLNPIGYASASGTIILLPDATAVPEPSTLGLTGAALLAVALRRRGANARREQVGQ
jgi:PEP-CTERM motif-containing protein